MPGTFLTDEQRARFGRFNEPPDEGQLGGFFHLDRTARRAAMTCNGARNQLGYAVQLGTVRFLGTFLEDPGEAPKIVTDYVADQLGLDPAALSDYGQREARWDHQDQIRRTLGYQPFDETAWFALARWLYTRCWLGNERPTVLFDRATARMVDQRVLLPGVTVLERLVAGVRERAELRLWRTLAALPNPAERARLLELLGRAEGSRTTRLDQLRRSPRKITATGLVKALERYEQLASYRGGHWAGALAPVPPGRLAELVRYAKAVRAQAVSQLTEDRKIATLVAFAATMPDLAADEALEVFDMVMDDLIRETTAQVQRRRLRTLRDLDAAALLLGHAWRIVIAAAEDPDCDVRLALAGLDIAAVREAERTVVELAIAPQDDSAAQLASRHRTIARFLPKLLETIPFQAHAPGRPVLDAIGFVRSLKTRKKPIDQREVPEGVLSKAWTRRILNAEGRVDKQAYAVGFTEALRDGLRRHEIFVPGLRRYGDPHARLLAPGEWQATRAQACEDLALSPTPGHDARAWADRLDGAYRTLADGLAANPAVRIEQRDGHDHLVLTGLDKLEVPESVDWLDNEVAARMPSVDLPEMVLEVHGWTPFLDDFTNVSGEPSRADDLTTSIAAVLCSESTNVGMAPVVNDSRDALKRDRLFWTEQNYLRAECTARATARMVAFHAAQPIVGECWGGGELASADGLRFVTPVRTINSRPNPKYFGGPGARRGITFYNYLFDMYVGFHGIIVPGTQRDSLYIMDGLLEQDSGIRPVEITSDTHGASEMVFGLFRLLGYQFSPRLADAGSATLYRTDPDADYGPLNALTRDRIRLDLIERHWDEILRVAASLRTGMVKASEILRVLSPGGRPTSLGRAIMEIGRLDRSAYLATYFDDELLRRKINTQLNRQESRHQLARAIFHGQKGEMRQVYREGQEDQLGALGLMLNVVVLWNTVYIQKIVADLRAEGHHIRNEDIARISPLDFSHINFHGRYSFALPPEVSAGQLRSTERPAVARV